MRSGEVVADLGSGNWQFFAGQEFADFVRATFEKVGEKRTVH